MDFLVTETFKAFAAVSVTFRRTHRTVFGVGKKAVFAEGPYSLRSITVGKKISLKRARGTDTAEVSVDGAYASGADPGVGFGVDWAEA